VFLIGLERTPQPKFRLGARRHHSGYIPQLGLGRADEVLLTLRLYAVALGFCEFWSKLLVSLLIESAKSKLLTTPPSFPAPLLGKSWAVVHAYIFGYTGPYQGRVGTFLQ